MNDLQYAELVRVLKQEENFAIKHDALEIHFLHGDCVGSDAIAHDVATSFGFVTHIFPANLPKFRAHCVADITEPEDKPLDRNRKMVMLCHALVATPATPISQRSGTWSTIGHAKGYEKRHYILQPDGTTRFVEKAKGRAVGNMPQYEADENMKKVMGQNWGGPCTDEQAARREGLTNPKKGRSDKPFFDKLRKMNEDTT